MIKSSISIALPPLSGDDLNNAWKSHALIKSNIACLISAYQEGEDPFQLLPDKYLESAEVVFSIAHYYFRQSVFEKAIFWMRKAYALDSRPVEIKKFLAELLLDRLIHDEVIIVSRQFSQEQEDDLRLAHQLFSEIWNEKKSSEVAHEFVHVACNLSITERLLGNIDRVAEVLNEASKIDDTSTFLKNEKAVLAMLSGDFSSACSELEGIPELSPEQILMHAESLKGMGRFEDALSRLDELLSENPDSGMEIIANILRIQILEQHEGIDSAISEVSKLIKENPKNASYLALSANLYTSSDNQSAARKKILAAKEFLTNDSRYSERGVVADVLFRMMLFEEAIPLYKELVTENKDSQMLQNFLTCLYETDRRREALERFMSLPVDVRQEPFYLRFATGLYLRTGELHKALENCKAYLEIESDDIDMRFHLLQILFRLGDHDEIRSFLDKPPDLDNAELRNRFFYAYILDRYGKTDDALRLAYETRRKYIDDPQAHLSFIGFILFRDMPFPDEVGIDTAFTLEEPNGQRHTYVIENGPNLNIQSGEISPDNPIAELSLGHKVGDRILIRDDGPFKDERNIVRIQNKYLYALNDSREKFSAHFPTESGFISVPIKTDSKGDTELQPFLSLISNHSGRVSELEGLYESHPIPIGMYAQLLGVNPIDAWMGLMTSVGTKIFCCNGTEPERRQALSIIESNTVGYVIDPITLFSLDVFKIQEPVCAVTGKLGITQSSFDLLQDLLEERKSRMSAGGYDSYYKKGGELFRNEVTKNDIEESIRRIEGVIEWAKKNCELLPAYGKKDFPMRERRLKDYLHIAFTDTLLAAEGSGRTLLSDDLRLRDLGKHYLNLDGVWLQPILINAYDSGLMAFEDYAKSIISLVRSNHHFITISKDVLLYSTNIQDIAVTEDFKALIESLGEKNTDLASSLKVVIPFLRSIWGLSFADHNREYFVYALLNALKADRRYRYNVIFNVIFSIPWPNSFYIAIKGWCEGHFIPFPLDNNELGEEGDS